MPPASMGPPAWHHRSAGAYRFDRVLDDVADDVHVTLLPDAVDAVDSLGLGHGVPMRLHQVHGAGCGEIDALAGGAHGGQHDAVLGVGTIKQLKGISALLQRRLSVNAAADDSLCSKGLFNKVEHLGPAAENNTVFC